MKWPDAVHLHAEARELFKNNASAVPEHSWLRADREAWSPAHITKHVSLAYVVLLNELTGGAGMRIRTKLMRQTFLRLFMVPGLLNGKPFPKGARAPKETRPNEINESQAEAIAEFEALSLRFEQRAQKTYELNRKIQLTHAYFGRADLVKSVQLCARHVLHHAKAIAEPKD
jgi:hypothetical protein